MIPKILKTITRRERFFDSWKQSVTYRYLTDRRAKLIAERGQCMAVFANDWIGIGVFVEGTYEKVHLEALRRFLEPLKESYVHWDVADIGANIGNHSVYFSRLFKKVFAFEPHPSVFHLLMFNASHSDNIEPHNIGLGENEHTADLHEDENNMGASSTRYEKDGASTVKIEVKPLDALGIEFGELGLVKIDVEGMEADVLKGAAKTIQSHTPIVVLEQNLADFSGEGEETESIRWLRSLGYKLCWLDRTSPQKPWLMRRLDSLFEVCFGRTVVTRIVTDDVVPKGTYSMLIAVPPKHHASLGL